MDSPFGSFFKSLREKNSETQTDAAKWLGVRPRDLSSVEHGMLAVPPEWEAMIIKHYSLNKKEQEKLRQALNAQSFYQAGK